MRWVWRLLLGILGLAVVLIAVWSFAIGPVAVARVITHGTTTVWDHLEYPGRELRPSTDPQPWPMAADPMSPPNVVVEGAEVPLESVLADRDTLAFVVVNDGELAYEWYAPGHSADTPSMVFSVSKSILSLLIGAAIDDGLIDSVNDSVTVWLPELTERGFDDVTIEDLLQMDSNLDYVEGDNPFGAHVEFNYTPDLETAILALRVREQPDPEFRYKSGDNAVLGLVLDRALEDETITGYLQERLWDPLGLEDNGIWSTDRDGGMERTWCCLATTARDLARFGQLVLDEGSWRGEQLLPAGWLEASFQPAYETERWPAEYDESTLANYGYQWWLTGDAWLALGKGGQYLYVDPVREVVIVRLGETQGNVGWVEILSQVAEATD